LEHIYTILASLGGASVVAIAVIKWVSNLAQSKITLNWDQENKKELELLKSNLSSNQEIVKLSLASFNNSNVYITEKRVEAINYIWLYLLRLREFITPIRTMFSVLKPEEYNRVLKQRPDIFMLAEMTNDKFYKLLKEELENFRPYLGETLWSLFFSYRAFLSRTYYLFNEGREKGNVTPWYVDDGLVSILRNAIGNDQIDELSLNNIESFTNATTMYEQLILKEMNRILSGTYNFESNFYDARRLLNITMKETVGKNDIA
jgi:hypothetical protein